MAERAVSFLGLLVLMGLAYLFSKDRKAIKYRTIVWGVGLQLTLAVIILSQGVVSFLGMFVLIFLITLFLFEKELEGLELGAWAVRAIALVGSAAIVAGAYFLSPYRITDVALVLAVLTVLVATPLGKPLLARRGLGASLLLGLGAMWANGIDGVTFFGVLSDKVAAFLGLSNEGAVFLFDNLAKPQYFFPGSDTWPGFGFQFAFSVLPTIIFFSAFMSVMYYLGIVQVIVASFAKFMHWSMKTSGSETMSCSANVFVGQTEAPFLVKPFLKDMTVSELHAVMTGGFATIAGGVLAGYIQMGVNPGHLIAASVMSAPAALVIAKLLYPETEQSVTAGDVEIPRVQTADNVVEAAANGTTDGLKLALNVGAMLIAFIALIAVLDSILGFFDGIIDGRMLGGAAIEYERAGKTITEYAGYFPGSMKTLFGTLLAPLAFVMGVPWVDAGAVGNLLGIKMTVNEFVSYGVLSQYIAAGELQPRSEIIATYALCGFANFSSIGIQIGGLSALAPELRPVLSKIGLRAMCGGALASFMTATVAGILS
ncbi:MAG: nucleoside transporter C-terminal domain-containing protein [Acidobacteriota bacterium]